MRLYLTRHGEANSPAVDPSKDLSLEGKLKIGQLANFLAHSNRTVASVYHSGKKRAEHTAKILADKIAPNTELKILTGLMPNDEIDQVVELISLFTVDTLLVGHLPYMSKLLSFLCTNSESQLPVIFNTGTTVCLYKTGIGQWAIEWILDPSLLV